MTAKVADALQAFVDRMIELAGGTHQHGDEVRICIADAVEGLREHVASPL